MGQKITLPEIFPIMHTERLDLVELHESHEESLFNMRREPEHHLYTDTVPDQSHEDTKAYIQKMIRGVSEGKWLIWGIQIRETEELVGTISLWNFNDEESKGELGFGLIKGAQKKGYMKEVLEIVIEYGFETLGLRCIEAYTEEANTNSIQLLEKMGFEHSDTIQESGYQVGKTFVMRIYTLNKK